MNVTFDQNIPESIAFNYSYMTMILCLERFQQ